MTLPQTFTIRVHSRRVALPKSETGLYACRVVFPKLEDRLYARRVAFPKVEKALYSRRGVFPKLEDGLYTRRDVFPKLEGGFYACQGALQIVAMKKFVFSLFCTPFKKIKFFSTGTAKW